MSDEPAYRPEDVKRLALAGQVVGTGQVYRWLANHEYDAKETLVEVLCAVEENGRWISSCTLVNGATADEYVVAMEKEDWYLKFYIDGDEVMVQVWSCCWDGVVH